MEHLSPKGGVGGVMGRGHERPWSKRLAPQRETKKNTTKNCPTSAGASMRSTGADVTTGASVCGDPPLQAGTA